MKIKKKFAGIKTFKNLGLKNGIQKKIWILQIGG